MVRKQGGLITGIQANENVVENLLGCSVDVVRMHRNMNKLLLNQIERDGIYVF